MASAASLTVGIFSLAAWAIRRGPAHYGWFGIAALASGAATFVEPLMYQADGVDAYLSALRWQVSLLAVFLAGLTLFLKDYGRMGRSRVAQIVLGLLAFLLVANLLSPATILYSDISGLRPIELPWGETLAFADGRPNRLAPLVALPGLLITLLFVRDVRRLWRAGERRRSVSFVVAFTLFAIAFWVLGPLSELGVIDAPYLFSFAYLALVLFVGSELTSEVARAAVLTDEMRESQRRWRSLRDHVELFVTEIDADGRVAYVNPYFARVTGWSPEDVVGRHFQFLIPEDRRKESVQRFEEQQIEESIAEASLVTSDGRTRVAMFAHVPLLDPAGELTGVISLGADVTEQRMAEATRDTAIRQLEELQRQLREENLLLRSEFEVSHGFDEIIGDSDVLQYVLNRIEQVAETDTTVLIEGETGVGKELVARAIHRRSARAEGPFITINCGTLPANLVESELFGHERGAFTGANNLRRGRFELANGGTVFLDEIGELPLDLQVKLLRVLEEGSFERVGSSTSRTTDVRVIAATNRNLLSRVTDGEFREDLFYRLNVYPLTVPPLRSRPEDIPLLVHHFVRRFASRLGKPVEEVPGPILHTLKAYAWPGNVRELQNVLERAVILSSGRTLVLPDSFNAGDAEGLSRSAEALPTLAEAERDLIQQALATTEWRIEGEAGAARVLGLNPSTLRSRMKKHGIRRPS
jgi:PAS domain S-box-containing protein